LNEGYWKLSKSRISKIAGVPATRFKQHFADIDEAYLEGIEQLAKGLFGPLVAGCEGDDWTASVCRQMDSLVARARGDEAAAHLVLTQILAPGVRGLTRKEMLVQEVASRWNSVMPEQSSGGSDRTRTAMAGLWAALARALSSDPKSLQQMAPTYAYLWLAPSVGPKAAHTAVTRNFSNAIDRAKALP
jgi:hypothetical protein